MNKKWEELLSLAEQIISDEAYDEHHAEFIATSDPEELDKQMTPEEVWADILIAGRPTHDRLEAIYQKCFKAKRAELLRWLADNLPEE